MSNKVLIAGAPKYDPAFRAESIGLRDAPAKLVKELAAAQAAKESAGDLVYDQEAPGGTNDPTACAEADAAFFAACKRLYDAQAAVDAHIDRTKAEWIADAEARIKSRAEDALAIVEDALVPVLDEIAVLSAGVNARRNRRPSAVAAVLSESKLRAYRPAKERVEQIREALLRHRDPKVKQRVSQADFIELRESGADVSGYEIVHSNTLSRAL